MKAEIFSGESLEIEYVSTQQSSDQDDHDGMQPTVSSGNEELFPDNINETDEIYSASSQEEKGENEETQDMPIQVEVMLYCKRS
jgi:C1A family cysteine protease